jgi:hypothetical protein
MHAPRALWDEYIGDVFIQLVEVDVCEGRAYHAPLRCPAEGGVVFPCFAITRLAQSFDQPQEAVVVDALPEDIHQYGVIDVIETPFDVALDEPLAPNQVFCIWFRAVWQPFMGRNPWDESESCGS